jgi:prolipoprotein diacylglyceryl transferase
MTATPVLITSFHGLDITYPPLPTVLGISPHGILAAVGIAVGAWLLVRRLRAENLPVEAAESALMWGIPAGIVGARLDYVISHPGQFSSVQQALALWNGGLALFGGLIAGTLTATVVLWRHGAPVRRVLDAAAPAIPLAVAIGRIGDLLLTDHLGLPTKSRFAIAYVVEAGYRLAPGFGPSPAAPPGVGESCREVGRYYAGCAYQLSAGYDLIGAAALALVLLLLARRRPPPGVPLAVFGLWYGTQRLLLDFTRGIDERPMLGLTGTQLLAVALIVVSGFTLAQSARRHRASPDDTTGAEHLMG